MGLNFEKLEVLLVLFYYEKYVKLTVNLSKSINQNLNLNQNQNLLIYQNFVSYY